MRSGRFHCDGVQLWSPSQLLSSATGSSDSSFSFRQIPNILLVPSSGAIERDGVEAGKRILGNCPHILCPCLKKKLKGNYLTASLRVSRLSQAGFLMSQGLISRRHPMDHLPLSPDTLVGPGGVSDVCSLRASAGFVPEDGGPACLFARLEAQPFQPVCQLNYLATCLVYAINPSSCTECRLPEGTGTTE